MGLVYALHNFGYFNYRMEQYDTALVICTESLDLLKELNHSFAYFVCLGNLGLVYSGLSDFDLAEEHLLRAIDTLSSLGDYFYLPEFMNGYANIHQQKGAIKQAITYASRALEITDNLNFKRDASHLFAQLYEISGRIDSAYYYQSLYLVAHDSLKNIESVLKMANLRRPTRCSTNSGNRSGIRSGSMVQRKSPKTGSIWPYVSSMKRIMRCNTPVPRIPCI